MNIIWDFDGTIFDTYPRILNAFDAVLNRKYHLGVPQTRLEDLVLVDTKHCARTIADQHHLDFESLLKEVRSYYDDHGEEETVLPGIADILLESQGTNHFLVTHRDKDSLMKRLEKANLHRAFVEIVTKESGFKEKPDPESFQYLIDKYGLGRNATVGIGDRDIDVGAARRAGIQSILISRRSEIEADFRIEGTEQLRPILRMLAESWKA